MHTSINAKRHNIEHLSVNKLKAIKLLPVWKLNTECLHILQKFETLTNLKNHCSKAIIFRMLINQIVWELDSLCLWLRPHCRKFCLAMLAHWFAFVLDFWACCPASTSESRLQGESDIILFFFFFYWSLTHPFTFFFFFKVCTYFCPKDLGMCEDHKGHQLVLNSTDHNVETCYYWFMLSSKLQASFSYSL